MSGKQSLVLVALLVLGLAALAMSAQVDRPWGAAACDACQYVVTAGKAKIPQIKPVLEQLCNTCPKKDQCLEKIDQALAKLENQDPIDTCRQLMLCQ